MSFHYYLEMLKMPFVGKVRKVTFTVAAAALAVFLLVVFVGKSGDLDKLAVTLKSAFGRPWYLAGGVAMFSLSLLCGMIRWYILLRTLKLPITSGEMFRLYATGHFFNVLGPGATGGDFVKGAWIAIKCPGRRTQAVTSIAAERLIGFFAMIIFVSTISLFRKDFFYDKPVLTLLIHIVYSVLAGCIVLMLLLTVIDWGRLSSRVHPKKGGMAEKTLEAMLNIWKTFRVCLTHTTATLGAIALSFANHVIDVMCYFLLSRSVAMTLPLRDLFVISPISNAVAALPVTPGGAGVRENMLQVMMDSVGVPRTQSTALGLLMFGAIIFWAVVSGTIMVSGLASTKKKPFGPSSDTMECAP